MTMTKAARPVRENESFSGTIAPKEVFKSDLFKCSFERCIITDKPKLNGRIPMDVSFRECNFTGAKLIGLEYSGRTAFYECDMSEVLIYDCTGNWTIYIKDSILRGASIRDTNLRLVMEDCDLTGAALTCSRLSIIADRCNFDTARFNLSHLSGTFTECILPFAAAEPQNLPLICSARQTQCTGGGTFTYGGVGGPVFTPQKEEGK